MELIIQKIDSSHIEEAITFIAMESLNSGLEMNPELRKNYGGRYKEIIDNSFIDSYRNLIGMNSKVFCAYLDNKIVGAGYIDNNNYIDSLYVKEEFRKKGIGTEILKNIIDSSIQNGVIKVDARISTLSFYKKQNFKIVKGASNMGFMPMELDSDGYGK